ncbi:MAG: PDZ domain-containing protein [Chloroflexales bacterium]|nr:PDZ domain-containing protein [Chloroflexales bacterium]
MILGRKTIIAILIGFVAMASWCAMFSGAAGWLMGYDLARRETRAQLLPSAGVLVVRVERGGPAAKAGIKRGDMIIALNSVSVDDVPSLRDELFHYHPGDNIAITYRHDYGENIAQVQLGKLPGAEQPYLGIYYTARAEEPADL